MRFRTQLLQGLARSHRILDAQHGAQATRKRFGPFSSPSPSEPLLRASTGICLWTTAASRLGNILLPKPFKPPFSTVQYDMSNEFDKAEENKRGHDNLQITTLPKPQWGKD